AHYQQGEGSRVSQAHRPEQARRRFRNKTELRKWRCKGRAACRHNVITMQQHGGANADGKAVDGRHKRLWVAYQDVQKIDGDRFKSPFGPPLKIGDVAASAE